MTPQVEIYDNSPSNCVSPEKYDERVYTKIWGIGTIRALIYL